LASDFFEPLKLSLSEERSMQNAIVSYIRVSTATGLGLEAQRTALARFAEAEGLDLAAEFVEVESGKGADALDRRPQLAAALAEARRRKCAVTVAKLDRLSRDVPPEPPSPWPGKDPILWESRPRAP
jgi:hypothetical protein